MINLKVKNTLQMTSLLFGMVILFCYIGWHLGYEGLLLIGNINIPLWLNIFICCILLFVQLSLAGSFILNEYSFKICKFVVPLIFLEYTLSCFGHAGLISGPIATIYFIILGIFRKTFKRSTLRAFLISLLTIGYQMIAIVLKTGSLNFNIHIPIYVALMFSIDMVLLTLLIWSIGGVKNVHGLELLVFPGRIRDDKHRNESRKLDSQSTSDIPVDRFEKWVMRAVIAVVQIVQWIFILWVCSLDKLFLEALVMTTSLICHGMIISKRKHLKPIILCTLAATVMSYIGVKFSVSFQYSQFFPIIIGLALIYTVYRISYQLEIRAKETSKQNLERIEALEQKVTKAWERLDELS